MSWVSGPAPRSLTPPAEGKTQILGPPSRNNEKFCRVLEVTGSFIVMCNYNCTRKGSYKWTNNKSAHYAVTTITMQGKTGKV